MKKVKVIIIVSVLCILLCYAVQKSRQIQYSLLDTIETRNGQKSVEGFTVCNTDDKDYTLYSLDKYNVDFNKESILLTSYELNKVKIGEKKFIKIFVGNKHENVINVYLLNKPNLFFDDKSGNDQCFIKEYIE